MKYFLSILSLVSVACSGTESETCPPSTVSITLVSLANVYAGDQETTLEVYCPAGWTRESGLCEHSGDWVEGLEHHDGVDREGWICKFGNDTVLDYDPRGVQATIECVTEITD